MIVDPAAGTTPARRSSAGRAGGIGLRLHRWQYVGASHRTGPALASPRSSRTTSDFYFSKGDLPVVRTLRTPSPVALLRALAAALLLLASTTSLASAAARQWSAAVGAETSSEEVQANAFLPRALWIDAGDQITWTLKSGEIHTLTFLGGAPAPPLIVPNPSGGIMFNPAAVAPAGGSTFAGTGYTSSGLLAARGQTYSLTFPRVGDFPFLCLIHSQMTGVVHVAPAGTPYPFSQAFYDLQARGQAALLFADGLRLAGQARAAAGPSGVSVGAGEVIPVVGGVMDARFYPTRRTAKVGQTVLFHNPDPETPHTVTFGAEPAGGPLGAFTPAGTDGPGHATIGSPTQAVNSGFLGAAFPLGTDFRATFTRPGVYPYICALHDDLGMVGQIVVLPADD